MQLRKEVINRITVAGFKSIVQEQSIEIRPLTILAGANSSGKSSIMQPILLLKQTLEAPYDPGALLLNGPNVRFTSVEQLLSHISSDEIKDMFCVGIEIAVGAGVKTCFKRAKSQGFDVEETTYNPEKNKYRLSRNMSRSAIRSLLGKVNTRLTLDATTLANTATVDRNRCFLRLYVKLEDDDISISVPLVRNEGYLQESLLELIHLPGLRGNPERTYPVTAVGSTFPGTFENYVASVILHWQQTGNAVALKRLNDDLKRLRLTGKVLARPIGDTQVELLVNRFLRSTAEDMVSIADVGFGVSQTLPVVVALHVAKPGQLIYVEQPEIHLHPRAQLAMAEVLANAAIAGKRIVVETHSSLLLLGIQTLVAEKELSPELVKLHWFTRQEDGSTQITSADLDKTGAFGDWPEDFADVELNSESRYLDAAEARLREK
ncbi:MAG TPA: DUF3696 domain-containing protein [Ktedonobacteraceae bacterium]|nr:DUF3696 domain-containing protein [Ktedonobacteraceae bacterium]